jgi:hypothetical protein
MREISRFLAERGVGFCPARAGSQALLHPRGGWAEPAPRKLSCLKRCQVSYRRELAAKRSGAAHQGPGRRRLPPCRRARSAVEYRPHEAAKAPGLPASRHAFACFGAALCDRPARFRACAGYPRPAQGRPAHADGGKGGRTHRAHERQAPSLGHIEALAGNKTPARGNGFSVLGRAGHFTGRNSPAI